MIKKIIQIIQKSSFQTWQHYATLKSYQIFIVPIFNRCHLILCNFKKILISKDKIFCIRYILNALYFNNFRSTAQKCNSKFKKPNSKKYYISSSRPNNYWTQMHNCFQSNLSSCTKSKQVISSIHPGSFIHKEPDQIFMQLVKTNTLCCFK